MLITGTVFTAAAIGLFLIVRINVTILASVLMLVVGVSSFKAAARAKALLCPNCRKVPVKR